MKYITSLFFCIYFLLSCKDSIDSRILGDNIVEAKFINDTSIDGKAKYYSKLGILEAYYTFKNGDKNGDAVTYHENGKILDSMNYSNGLLNGQLYKFNTLGQLQFTKMYYYGIEVGDHSFFKNGKIYDYYFNSFDQKQIIYSRYDSLQKCDSLIFNAYPLITRGVLDRENPAIKIFIYFPHPPDFKVVYTMGYIDEQKKRQGEFILNSDRLFLDTTLKVPTIKLNYFLSVDYVSKSHDSTINVYFKTF